MTPTVAEVTNGGGAPVVERLVEAVRRGLQLGDGVAVSLTEVMEFTNINYVYRVEIPGRIFYLKVVTERPKRFPTPLPRERVFSEAEGLRRFRSLAGNAVLIPEVLFVDRDEMALGMSDVGEGRQVLFSVLADRFDLFLENAEALGRALGAIHGGTRGVGSIRPKQEEAILRRIVFEGLLAPGAKHVLPETWDSVSAEMQEHNQCLIHADLWSKNLLVRQAEPVALVDFEGVCYGDPAFDLGTLIAVSILPALENPDLIQDSLAFTSRLLTAWRLSCGDDDWAAEVFPRTFRSTACFIAIRGFGPFPYEMSEGARRRVSRLARSLAAQPPTTIDDFRARVTEHALAAPEDANPPS